MNLYLVNNTFLHVPPFWKGQLGYKKVLTRKDNIVTVRNILVNFVCIIVQSHLTSVFSVYLRDKTL